MLFVALITGGLFDVIVSGDVLTIVGAFDDVPVIMHRTGLLV